MHKYLAPENFWPNLVGVVEIGEPVERVLDGHGGGVLGSPGTGRRPNGAVPLGHLGAKSMSPSTHQDAWLFADAEAWKEFGEAYAAEFDGDLVVVDESVPVPRSGG